jgi:hypothetical protein|tara:strand:+ start:97 stop:345 length:249 start_codon:yes stop_codon:yes gene_type:complete
MWGKALWRIYKITVTIGIAVLVAVVAFWISMLTGCSSQKQVKVNDYICVDHYHENFYLEDYDYWLCLTSDAVCRIDTFYIAE